MCHFLITMAMKLMEIKSKKYHTSWTYIIESKGGCKFPVENLDKEVVNEEVVNEKVV